MNTVTPSPQIVKRGMFDIQVCVPSTFTDDEVTKFANTDHPCGTENGWTIRREGDKALDGTPERCQCDNDRNKVHLILDA